MKRFSLRELLLVSAPLILIMAGMIGAKWRHARREAALPRIESCSLRAPYADEAFQGATRVLNCRSSSPETQQCQPIYTVINAAGQRFRSQDHSWMKFSLGGIAGGWIENGRHIYTTETMINPSILTPGIKPTQVEARLYDEVNTNQYRLITKKSFALQTDGIKVPSFQELRHTTTQVERVQFFHLSSTNPKVSSLKITLSPSSNPSNQPNSTFKVINEELIAPDRRLCFDWRISMTESSTGTSQILEIYIDENYKGSWVKGDKAVLDISLNHEWPLRIEVDFPDKEPTKEFTDLPFKSRLAPIPTKLSPR